MNKIRNKWQVAWQVPALVFVCLLPGTPGDAQKGNDDAELQLQAALHKQLVDGDLEGAIKQYKDIVARFSGNRPVAAKALIEMGGCYEKLGKEEARKAYERVLREYGDQGAAAAEARARLAALSGLAAGKNHGELTVRRVWAGPEVDTSGTPSPDGRFLTYVDLETGDLALRDLLTGENRRLTKKGTWSNSAEWALSSVVSPDGKQATYDWLNKDYQWDLRVVGLDGSGPRILYSNKEVYLPDPVAWSPDGRYILARFFRRDRTVQIVLVSITDGSIRALKTLDWRSPEKMCFSPDGQTIAYDFPPQQDSPNRDIFLLSSDGSRQAPLVENPADDRLLGWTPDGTRVLFASDRTGSMSVWSVRVANGKSQGVPELIKADVGQIAGLGFTRKGAFYYGLQIGTQDVYVATLDVAAGKLLTPPRPIATRYLGFNSSPYWSPDGQYLAYASERRPLQLGPGSKVIVIRNIKTGEERELVPKLTFFQLGPWSPDGRSLLLTAEDPKGRGGVFRIDTETASVSSVQLSEPGMVIRRCVWSPDGKAILYLRDNTAAKSFCLVRGNMETGQEKELYRVAAPGIIGLAIAVSPDGQHLAFVLSQSRNQPVLVMVISTNGGEPRKLLEVREPAPIRTDTWSIAWTPDSRYIVIGKGRFAPQEPKIELWRIPAEGGASQKLGLAMDYLREVRFHPDGRQIAFTAGFYSSEVWVMENFLPVSRAAR